METIRGGRILGRDLARRLVDDVILNASSSTPDDEILRRPQSESSGGGSGSRSFSLNPSDPGFIAWYCFLTVFVALPMVGCASYCLYLHWRRYRDGVERARQERINQEIRRIEANVKVFSIHQEHQKKKHLKHSMAGQTVRVTSSHLIERDVNNANNGSSSSSSDADDRPTTTEGEDLDRGEGTTTETTNASDNSPSDGGGDSGIITSPQRRCIRSAAGGRLDDDAVVPFLDFTAGCSICIEPFVEGDIVMHSMDTRRCPHLFHDQCILSWLVSRVHEPQCPCCRQEFARLPDSVAGIITPHTSIASHDEFARVFGGGGGGSPLATAVSSSTASTTTSANATRNTTAAPATTTDETQTVNDTINDTVSVSQFSSVG